MTETNTTKLKIDITRCQGHARCMEEAPRVFGLAADTNYAFILPGADVAADEAGVKKAIMACPEGAISWADSD